MSDAPALQVERVGGVALVQDGGRPGAMEQGVPPGGALFLEGLAAANRALGNAWDAPALECYGALSLRARGALHAAVDDRVVRLDDGEALQVPPPARARVCYVALHGGVDVPVVLGGRGTLPVAALGGLGGRALRARDVLCAAPTRSPTAPPARPALPITLYPDAPVRVIAGPDAARFLDDALATLLDASFAIGAVGDRVGVRLRGPALARRDDDTPRSMPMTAGAIQVTAGGEAIVLGPDHPTTGGYPVLAVVIAADLGALLARPPGAPVRFTAVDLAAARAAFRVARAIRGAGGAVLAPPWAASAGP